jgi:hypothetical protein
VRSADTPSIGWAPHVIHGMAQPKLLNKILGTVFAVNTNLFTDSNI